jgi:predicted DNA-binding transcriptional regulator YafY
MDRVVIYDNRQPFEKTGDVICSCAIAYLGKDGNTTYRDIDVIDVNEVGNVVALCKLRGEIRQFNPNNIISISNGTGKMNFV